MMPSWIVHLLASTVELEQWVGFLAEKKCVREDLVNRQPGHTGGAFHLQIIFQHVLRWYFLNKRQSEEKSLEENCA